ncbi:DUF6766 family protein [Amaricoccus sp.]|uniref:DUF6766 family protein n=1 Tax=Amaricoccus sp. TaxID=1872485 RepID=UPI001B751EAD|nr:DUF6766 family protein [Amaricoccus sp.]MBP7002701.1 hypothetical protein [Amaricoccus sp.]
MAELRDPASGTARALRENGLTLALGLLFGGAIVGMALAGWKAHDDFLLRHGALPTGLLAYLASGDFVSAVFENWESEFLQMAAYVMLTAFLLQKGSAESRDPDAGETKEPRPRGIGGFLYACSLGIALGALFVAAFLLHLWGSCRAAVADAALHGAAPPTAVRRLLDAGFWFESFQNWQSEFLSTAVLVVLSIVLRFRGSPESKRVTAPHASTGR